MLLKGITLLSALFAGLFWYMTESALWTLLPVFALSWILLLLIAFGFLCAVCAPVDLQKPQHEDSPFYRSIMHLYIEALISLVGLKLTTSGLERTPQSGRFLLVCNHQNESDPGILLHCFPKSQLAFISKQENAHMFIVGKFMHKILCQMVNRENDREALKTIIKCISLVKEDKVSIGAFPEGGIKVKDKLSHFRSGMFKIAQKADIPIVVCTLTGTSDLFHNIKRLKRTHVQLHLVDIIPDWQVREMTTVEIADRVHALMLEDLGESWKLEEEKTLPENQ